MGRNFYDDLTDKIVERGEPLIPDFIKNNSEVRTTTLPNGNEITESIPVTEWINELRIKTIHKKEYVEAELATQKSAARNEWNTFTTYWQENVFSDEDELKEKSALANVIALGSWFTGSVITGKKNWGHSSPFNTDSAGLLKRKPSILGRATTSFPVRLTLPWILAGFAYSQLMPNTWNNAVSTFKRDVLPEEFVNQCQSLRQAILENGSKSQWSSLSQNIHSSLQSGIHQVRELIAGTVNKD